MKGASLRALPVVNKAADLAPMTTACCNACRTCVTSNVLAFGIAGLAAAGTAIGRFTRRFAKP